MRRFWAWSCSAETMTTFQIIGGALIVCGASPRSSSPLQLQASRARRSRRKRRSARTLKRGSIKSKNGKP